MVNEAPTLPGFPDAAKPSESVYVMYNWAVASAICLRTEKCRVLELPRDLRLVAYLSRLRFKWELVLRIDSIDGEKICTLDTISIPDAAPDGWWPIGRKLASREISAWIEKHAGDRLACGVELRPAA